MIGEYLERVCLLADSYKNVGKTAEYRATQQCLQLLHDCVYAAEHKKTQLPKEKYKAHDSIEALVLSCKGVTVWKYKDFTLWELDGRIAESPLEILGMLIEDHDNNYVKVKASAEARAQGELKEALLKQKAELDSTMNAAFSRSLLAISRNVVASEQRTQYKEAEE